MPLGADSLGDVLADAHYAGSIAAVGMNEVRIGAIDHVGRDDGESIGVGLDGSWKCLQIGPCDGTGMETNKADIAQAHEKAIADGNRESQKQSE